MRLVKLKLRDNLIASGEVVASEGKQVHGVGLGLDEVVVRIFCMLGLDEVGWSRMR